MDNNKNNIKFGASYNVYDGIELLEHSIKSIRESVDFISVVYQTISNSGQTSDEDIKGLLDELVGKGLINEVFHYNPKLNMSLHWNELEKRKIGVYLSQNADSKYHLTIDTDEIYIKNQLDYVKQYMLDNPNIDAGYCQMQTYYKSTEFVLDPPEDYYVSLFFDIYDGERNYGFGERGVVLVDPTRNMKSVNPKVFTRNEIELHHISGVRKNYRKKVTNSSASTNYNLEIDKLCDWYDNFDGSTLKALWPGLSPCKFHNLKRVEDRFNIKF